MAKRYVEVRTDDLTGEELVNGAGKTVAFSYQGSDFEIDLSTDNVAAFDEAMASWITAGRKVSNTRRGRQARQAPQTASSGQAADIRAWAAENGHTVSSRGRIPAELRAAYEDAR